ncbi:MAG: arsenite efflux transporter metallochaperone ArsD [Balneolaceae bacterium]
MEKLTKQSTRIDIYDPAMCCSTGVCGPDVDDELIDFSNDVKWLKDQGLEVKRYNLGQEPEAFKSNPEVLSRLQKKGSQVLPLIMINGAIVSEGGYPDRRQFSEWLKLSSRTALQETPLHYTQKVETLVALSASAAAGSHDTLQQLYQQGITLGLQREELVRAIQTGIDIRQQNLQETLQTANELIGVTTGGCTPGGGCC